jgi:carboxypeptidase Taq
MLNGELAVVDLPAAWNDKMEELLGIVPPTDSEGCLQDVHWSRPGFGYFPTYALGNLYAAQILANGRCPTPEILDELAQGKTDTCSAGWAKIFTNTAVNSPPPNWLSG